SVGVLGVIQGLSWPPTDWAAPPRRRRLVDDRTRPYAPRARMDGWWTFAARDLPSTLRTRRKERSITLSLTPTTVLMDESPGRRGAGAMAGSSGRAPWRSSG